MSRNGFFKQNKDILDGVSLTPINIETFEEEAVLFKNINYLEYKLTDKEFLKLTKELENLEKKIKEYYEKQVIYEPLKVETQEYIENLGYVTLVKLFNKNYMYYAEEEEELVDDMIYGLLKTLEKHFMDNVKSNMNVD